MQLKLNKLKILFLLLLLSFAQQKLACQSDTILYEDSKPERVVLPVKATMLAASFPGLGQIYNRKYWKIPVVYAGFGALGYSIVYNSNNHSKYLEAYRDVSDLVPETNSYSSIEFGIEPEEFDRALESDSFNEQSEAWVKDQLLNGVDYYRRYRDLSYIGVALWYLITILDANVDANLNDYEIGEDLSIVVEPTPISTVYGNTIGVGVRVTF
jgi:hypothetical protein